MVRWCSANINTEYACSMRRIFVFWCDRHARTVSVECVPTNEWIYVRAKVRQRATDSMIRFVVLRERTQTHTRTRRQQHSYGPRTWNSVTAIQRRIERFGRDVLTVVGSGKVDTAHDTKILLFELDRERVRLHMCDVCRSRFMRYDFYFFFFFIIDVDVDLIFFFIFV